MTRTTSASTSPATVPDAPTPVLTRQYAARFAFAILWAGLFVLTSSPYGAAAFALAVFYPLVDLAGVVLDARSTATDGRSRAILVLNAVLSAAAAAALLTVGTGDVGDVLVVWGAWAIAAGAVQLAVGVQRRKLRGQVPIILSGALSVVAGTFFVASAAEATSVGPIAGYAVVGGLFFLVSALRQRQVEPAGISR